MTTMILMAVIGVGAVAFLIRFFVALCKETKEAAGRIVYVMNTADELNGGLPSRTRPAYTPRSAAEMSLRRSA